MLISWAQARGIVALLQTMELSKKDQEVLSRFVARIH
jgi:hypothetical protein